MMGFMFWLLLQVVTTGMFFMWYAKRHPSDAMRMFMTWRRFFSK